MNDFLITGLDATRFMALFTLGDARLRERAIVRRVADASPGYPCRVSLQDAALGDELLLLHHEHHAVPSPYRAAGPIFVRRGAAPAALAVNEVPEVVLRRQISLRAYDAGHLMRSGEVCDGPLVAAALRRLFADRQVAYVHLHNAKQGCYSCAAQRAQPGS